MLLRPQITVIDFTRWGKVNTVLACGIGGSIHSLTTSKRVFLFNGVIKTGTYFYRHD